MDYIEIMLRGYTNENERKFLNKYFIREFRNAEKEHYEINEFFNGLVNGIETLKNQYQIQLNNRARDLCLMLEIAENDTIEYCNNELSSLSLENYTINLPHFTNNRFPGHLYYNEVEFIGNEIAKAYKVLNQPKQPEAVNPDEVKKELFKLKENNFDNVQPDKVINHFKQLVDNRYITQLNFEIFIKTVFEKNQIVTSKIEIIKPNSKSRVKKIFYTYYETYSTQKYGVQKKYIKLLSDNFTGFDYTSLSTNFSK